MELVSGKKRFLIELMLMVLSVTLFHLYEMNRKMVDPVKTVLIPGLYRIANTEWIVDTRVKNKLLWRFV